MGSTKVPSWVPAGNRSTGGTSTLTFCNPLLLLTPLDEASDPEKWRFGSGVTVVDTLDPSVAPGLFFRGRFTVTGVDSNAKDLRRAASSKAACIASRWKISTTKCIYISSAYKLQLPCQHPVIPCSWLSSTTRNQLSCTWFEILRKTNHAESRGITRPQVHMWFFLWMLDYRPYICPNVGSDTKHSHVTFESFHAKSREITLAAAGHATSVGGILPDVAALIGESNLAFPQPNYEFKHSGL